MRLFEVDTLEQAVDKILTYANKMMHTATILPIEDSLGRVLSENITSKIDVPGFDRSTVDGYAVIAKDTQGASESIPVFLDVIGEVQMGESVTTRIQTGQCMYVPTGGMLPENADAMVMVEYCERFDDCSIAVYDAVSIGRNTVHRGEDVLQNQVVLTKGSVIRAQEIGVMAAVGVTHAPVFSPLNLSIISTGDELEIPGTVLRDGHIYDINTDALSALARANELSVIRKSVIADDEQGLKAALKQAMGESDIVLVSGGSSQGKKDMTSRLIEEVADKGVLTHGLALKPGKPTIIGYDQKSESLMIGLPGHPVAAMMVFELVVLSSIRKARGQNDPVCVHARMKTNIACDPGKANCIAVELQEEDDGFSAEVIHGKSGLITTLTKSQGYILTEQNKEGLKVGELVRVHLF